MPCMVLRSLHCSGQLRNAFKLQYSRQAAGSGVALCTQGDQLPHGLQGKCGCRDNSIANVRLGSIAVRIYSNIPT